MCYVFAIAAHSILNTFWSVQEFKTCSASELEWVSVISFKPHQMIHFIPYMGTEDDLWGVLLFSVEAFLCIKEEEFKDGGLNKKVQKKKLGHHFYYDLSFPLSLLLSRFTPLPLTSNHETLLVKSWVTCRCREYGYWMIWTHMCDWRTSTALC